MLAGQYIVHVGKEFRVALPKTFREQLGEKIVITYGFENSLIVFSEKSWEGFVREISGKSVLLAKTRDLRRVFIGGALSITCDIQGRFLIPEYLRGHIEAQNEVVFVGQETYVEVWNKKKWDEYNGRSLKDIGSIAEELAKTGKDE